MTFCAVLIYTICVNLYQDESVLRTLADPREPLDLYPILFLDYFKKKEWGELSRELG